MRILHLLNDIENIGNGINNLTVDLACAQADGGDEVWVVSGGGGYEELLAQHGVTHLHLDQTRSPATTARAVAAIRSTVRRVRPDVVHAHNVTGVLLAAAALIGRPVPLITTIHREERPAALTRFADRVIVLSESGQRYATQLRVPADRLRVLRNGTIGGARTSALEPLPPRELAHPAIVTVCGMYERKGIRDLLHALVQVRRTCPAHLYLVGDGPDREAFVALTAELGLDDAVVFERFQARPESWMAAADVVVLASRQEPAGLVLAEARAVGAAIVATDVGGIPDMLDGGRAGLLAPPADPAGLAAALLRVLTDEQERDRLRAAGREGLDDLTLQRFARDVDRVYVDALAEHRTPAS